MALVTYVLGDCPGCRGSGTFGNIDVSGDCVVRGCTQCRYRETMPLPPLRKKILYLDQFFFSHAFRGKDLRFVEAARRIAERAAQQLLVVPYSTVHEAETHQWGQRHAELFEFIKATSRGHEFMPHYDVERTQIVKAFHAWLRGAAVAYQLEESDALEPGIHEWDGYLRFDVGRYMGDVDLIRDLKRRGTEYLLEQFPGWRQLRSTFEEDVEVEYRAGAKGYLESFVEYTRKLAEEGLDALYQAPISVLVVQSMVLSLPSDVSPEEGPRLCLEFFDSAHFRALPFQWLEAHILATMKAMVKAGAYMNREQATKRLRGFSHDLTHIASYAPYVDAFVMDQAMADLVTKPTVALEKRFGTRVFSLNNWDQLYAWLDELEAGMSAEHRQGLAAAYPN